jgi:thioredoxin-related protein
MKLTNKPLLILFSGSDWCKPCIKLRTNIIETETFMNFAKSHLILINADFPYHKKIEAEIQNQNEQLAEKYDKEGAFPKIVIIDKNQKVIFEKGYTNSTPDVFVKEIEAKLLQ